MPVDRGSVIAMRMFVAGLIAAAAVTFAGCSSFNEGPGPAPVALSGRVNNEGTRDVTGTTRLELELRNYAFKPTFLRAQPGQLLTLDLANTSDVAHTFTVVDQPNGVDVVVQPHHTMRVHVVAPLQGTLVFVCRFHEAMGMQGAIFLLPGHPVIGAGAVTSTTRTPFPSGWG